MEMNVTEIEQIERLTLQGQKPIPGPDGELCFIVPGNCDLKIVPPKRALPDHIQSHLEMVEADSFIAYVNKYKNDNSTLFQCIGKNEFRAVIDFFDKDAPSWQDHKVAFSPIYSDEWKTWNEIDGQSLTQRQFLEFIEDNSPDIKKPSSAELLDTAAAFEAVKKVEYKSGTKLADGTIQLKYEETMEGKGKGDIKIPAELEITIPVYKNDGAYPLRVIVRYRLVGPELQFTLKLHRPEPLKDDAFKIMALKIIKDTGLTPYAI